MKKACLFGLLLSMQLSVHANNLGYEQPAIYKQDADSITVLLPNMVPLESNPKKKVVEFHNYTYDFDFQEIDNVIVPIDQVKSLYPALYEPRQKSAFEYRSLNSNIDVDQKYLTTQTMTHFIQADDKGKDYIAQLLQQETFSSYKVAGGKDNVEFVQPLLSGSKGRTTLVSKGPVRRPNKADWSSTFSFDTVNARFETLSSDTATFQYQRSVLGAVPVFNSGEDAKSGVLYILGFVPFMRAGQDPNLLKYDVVYIDETGKKVFQTDFEFGQKKRSLDAVAAYKHGGKIFLVAKDVRSNAMSTLSFDMSGNIVNQSEAQPRNVYSQKVKATRDPGRNKANYTTHDSWDLSHVMFDEAGNIYFIGQYVKISSDRMAASNASKQNSMSRNFGNRGRVVVSKEYKAPFVIKFDQAGQLDNFFVFNQLNKPSKKALARIEPLQVSSDEIRLLIRYPYLKDRTHLAKVSNSGTPLSSKALGEGKGLTKAFQKMYKIKSITTDYKE